MNNQIFLDFAETLGYRTSPEIETDCRIILKYLDKADDLIKEKYLDYSQKNNIYDRSLKFHNFKEEKQYTIKHFSRFIETLSKESAIKIELANKITTEKFATLCHNLFPDVIKTLQKYQNLGNIYVLSDGRPSRRLTLEKLGLGKYCRGFYISDEIGSTKDNANFYNEVLKKTGVSSRVVFIDDQILNLDTFAKVIPIKGFYIDRHKEYLNYAGKYVYTNQLPQDLNIQS